MTAIVAGQGLGLVNTSVGLLGAQGQLGVAEQGRSGEKVVVNAANGNLVIQQQDEWLIGVGPDVVALRTYNSQAASSNDDNGDNWRLGLSRRVFGLTGTLNAVDSTIQRIDEDGHVSSYLYDRVAKAYVCRSSGGSFDTLSYNTTTLKWTWTDGDTRTQEVYGLVNGSATLDSRLETVADVDGNKFILSYASATSNLITRVDTSSASALSGESVVITYDTVAGKTNNIQSLTTTYKDAAGLTQSVKRVAYAYDANNRLTQVRMDLTPTNTADAKTYVTAYTYDDATGISRHVKTLIESDGSVDASGNLIANSKLEFGYDTSARVTSVSETIGAEVRVTSLVYAAGKTTIKDPLLQVTELAFDTSGYAAGAPKAGQLLKITAPAVGGVSQVTSFTYDANGNVATVTDPRGNLSNYRYDVDGNRVYERDAQGNVVERSFNAANEPLTETIYTARDTDGDGALLASGGLTTRFVYDAKGHLRFVISPEGRVTENQYNAAGQRTSTLQYSEGTYSTAAMASWSQDFSVGTAGITPATLPLGFALSNGALAVNSIYQTTGNAFPVVSTPVAPMGTTWRAEFTTPANAATGDITIGIESATARHAINIINGDMVVRANLGSAAPPVALGTTKASTTYVLEIVTQPDGGSQLYVYEKGKERSSGYSDLRTFGNWGTPALAIYTEIGNSYISANATYLVDNISSQQQPAEAQLAAWIATQQSTLAAAAQWTQDFTSATTGLRAPNGSITLPAGFALQANGSLGVTNVVQATAVDATVYGSPLTLGSAMKVEITTPPNSATGNLTIGMESGNFGGADYVRHAINISGGNVDLKAWQGSVSWHKQFNPVGTLLKNSTTYVLEVVTQLNGATQLYFYEKGQVRTSLYSDAQTFSKWKSPVLFFDTVVGPGNAATQGTISLDNFSVSSAHKGVQRTDYSYNTRGQLEKQTNYDSVSGATATGVADGTQNVTQYVYDQAGNVLKKIDGKLNVTSYSYDGLNRITSQTDGVGNLTATALTSTGYDDRNLKTVVTLANGLATTSTYDQAGHLLSVAKADGATALGTTLYTYDKLGRLVATASPTGEKSYSLYDEASRKVGEIDPENALTEYLYNKNNQVVQTKRYANKVDPAKIVGDGSGLLLVNLRPIAAPADDRSNWNIYDKAGRLVKTIDAAGAVVEYRYDGAGRQTDAIAYYTVLTPAQWTAIASATVELSADNGTINPGTLITLTPNTLDRRNRNFYSIDSLLVGQLDADNYYTANTYDAAGRLSKTVRYATQLGAVAEGNAPPTVGLSPTQDQIAYLLYNARNQLVGTVDAELYYTAYQYDTAGNKSSQIRYKNRVGNTFDSKTAPLVIGSAVTAPAAPASYVRADAEDQSISYSYDEDNRLKGSTELPIGLTTSYTYDKVGNITKTVRAVGVVADERTEQRRYDKLGRLTGELSGVGSKVLADWLTANAASTQPVKDAQTNLVWQQYGTQYLYDNAGRRIATIEPNGVDGAGLKTVYYYDKDGRITHSINALGEISQYDYNAFGEQKAATKVGTRLASVAGLTGGLNSALGTTVSSLLNITKDSTTGQLFDQRGLVKSITDALSNTSTRGYNAFGQLDTTVLRTSATPTARTSYVYDRRGNLRTSTELDLGNRVIEQNYDAFGRVYNRKDGKLNLTTLAYDRLGRQVQVTDANGATHGSTYDAFDRTLTITDGRGNSSSYVYDSVNRKVTLTTPELIQTITESNRFGQTVKVTNGRGAPTSFIYDADGQLKSATTPTGTSSTTYDMAGRVFETQDARGTVTRTTYDAANRVLTRIVDPTGLALKTEYRYDAKGQVAWLKSANNVWTKTEYNLKGEVTAVVVEPATGPDGETYAGALALRTEYTYDARGKTLTVIESAGTAQPKTTQYIYDAAGRRTDEIVDPPGLRLTTSYVYDQADNLVAKKDAKLQVTRYVYDAGNQLIYSVDATGAVVKTEYDQDGRVSRTTAYANRINLTVPTVLSNTITAADVTSRLTANAAQDEVSAKVYDKDGRLSITVDALGYPTKREYDAVGNITAVTRYFAKAGALSIAKQTGNLISFAAPTLTSTPAFDQVDQTVYDSANRAIWSVDAKGYATQRDFDANGNVTRTTRYYNALAFVTAGQTLLNKNWAPKVDIAGVAGDTIVASAPALDQTTYMVYDRADRATYNIDPENYVTSNTYDGLGNTLSTTRFANPLKNAYVSGVAPQLFEAGAAVPAAGGASYVQKAAASAAQKDSYTTYGYDKAGRQTDVSVNDLVGGVLTPLSVQRKQYNAAGWLTDLTDAYGTGQDAITHYNYDAAGRVIEEIAAQGKPEQAITRYEVDALGQRKKIIDPRGVEAAEGTSAWAIAERVRILGGTTATRTAAPAKGSADYNALITAYTATQTFDELGQVTQTRDPLGGLIDTLFDAFGNAVRVTDPNRNAGYFYFNQLNQATWSIDPNGYATETRFDAFGQVASIIKYANAMVGSWDPSKTPAAYASASEAASNGATYFVLRDGAPSTGSASSATNVLTDSAIDTKSPSTIWMTGPNKTALATSVTAPDGTSQSRVYQGNGTVGGDYVARYLGGTQLYRRTANTTYTISVWAKLVSGTKPTQGQLITSDYDNGVGNARASLEFSSITLDGTWRQYSITLTNVRATTEINFNDYFFADTASTAQIALWGAQVLEVPNAATDLPTQFPSASTSAPNLATDFSADTVNNSAGWYAGSNKVAAGLVTAPDGSSSARVYGGNGTAPNEFIGRIWQTNGYVLEANTTYTVTVWAKMVAGSKPTNGHLINSAYNDGATNADGSAKENRSVLTIADSNLDYTWRQFSLTFTNVKEMPSQWHNDYFLADIGSATAQIALWGVQITKAPNMVSVPSRFDVAPWGSSGVAVTANASAAPNGLQEADKIVEDTSSGSGGHNLWYVQNFEAKRYTYTVDLKAGERSSALVNIWDGKANHGVYVDLTSGKITGPNGLIVSSRIENKGNGWYSVSVIADLEAGVGNCAIWLMGPGGLVYTGNGTSGLYAANAALYLTAKQCKDAKTTIVHDLLGRQVKITDAMGFEESMSYDGLGNKKTYTAKSNTSDNSNAGGLYKYEYDRRGNLVKETLPTLVKQYNNTTGAVASTGNTVINQYEYDSRGNRTKSTEAVGLQEQRVTQYGYDLNNQLKSTTEEAMSTYTLAGGDKVETPIETRTYDMRGNLIEVKAADGARTLTYWDAQNRKIAEINPLGKLTTWAYTTGGQVTAQRIYGGALALPTTAGGTVPVPLDAANVRETLFSYDANGRLTETRVSNVTYGSRDASTLTYGVTTGDVTTTKQYDASGNVVKEVDARGNATFSYYDKLGQKLLRVDAERYVTQWAYDAAGNVASQARYANALPVGAVDVVVVGAMVSSLLAAIPSASDKRVVEYSYDRMNRKTEERTLGVLYTDVNANSGTPTEKTGTVSTKFEYNALGGVVRQTTATGEVTDMSYDTQGRLTRTQAPTFVDWENASVRPTSDIEYNGLSLQSRLIQRGKNDASEADDRVTSYTYGKNGLRTTEIDPQGNVTNFAFDVAQRITRRDITRKDPDGTVNNDRISVAYDLAGQQTEQITASKLATAPAYTQLKSEQTGYNVYGEVTLKGENGGAQRKIEYDNAGRVWRSNATDNGAVKVYNYDANGNATRELTSSELDLSSAAVLPTNSEASFIAVLSANKATPKYNIYDKLNRLVDSYEPPMSQIARAAAMASSTETITNVTRQDPFESGSAVIYGGAWVFRNTGTSTKSIFSKNLISVNRTAVLKLFVSRTVPTPRGGLAHGMWVEEYAPTGIWNGSEYEYARITQSRQPTADEIALDPSGALFQDTIDGRKFISVQPFRMLSSYAGDSSFPGGASTTPLFVVSGLSSGSIAAGTLYIRTTAGTTDWVATSFSKIKIDQADAFQSSVGSTLGTFDFRYELFDVTGEKVVGATGSLQIDAGQVTIVSIANEPRPDLVTLSYKNYLDWAFGNESAFNLSVHRKQVYNAYGENVRQISYKRDASNALVEVATDLAYNALGKLIEKKDPAVSITLENGSKTVVRPTTRYHYDALGRMVGSKDANGNINTLALLAGTAADQTLITSEFHADRRLEVVAGSSLAREGVKRNQYDVFGQLKRSVNENWDGVAPVTPYATTYNYNLNGQLIAIDRPGAADESYEVDSQGQRIAITLAPTANDTGVRYRETTKYDALGRVLTTTTAAGDRRSTNYAYAWVAAIAGGGGWRVTTTNADGTTVDDTDTFGRIRWHKDLGNHAFTYRYNAAGLLSGQTSLATDDVASGVSPTGLIYTGQNISFSYYGNGLLKDTIDIARQTWTKYRYDDRGNRVFEGYARNFGMDASPNWEYYQYAESAYDDAGRLIRVWDPKSDINYEYDAVGNRRRVLSKYQDGAQGGLQTQDYWYKYDNMNRFVLTMGALSSTNEIVQGTNGRLINYDRANQRKSAVTSSGTETYDYDAEGYLQEVKLNGSRIAWRDNDARGNVMVMEESNSEGVTRHTYVYDADNNLQTDKQELLKVGQTAFKLVANSSNALLNSGALDISVRTEYKDDGSVNNTVTTDIDYVYWDGAKLSQISIKASNPSNPRTWEPGSTTQSYDLNGHVERSYDRAGNRHFYYSTDADGRVLRREEVDRPDAAPSKQNRVAAQRSALYFQNYYFFNGREVGTVSNDPSAILKDYGQALAQGKQGAYYERKAVLSADFDQNYQAIGTNYPGRTASSYTVTHTGETLQNIAMAIWGDGSLWYLIAEANALTGTSQLTQGQRLVISNKVTNIHNNTQTSRPYDAAQAMGEINPTLPDPPPPPTPGGRGGCGGLGMVLMVVVAVVVTVMTAGAALTAIAPSLASAAGAMAGATTAMGTMLAAGTAALTGGVAGAVGIAAAAIGAAAGSIASQLVGMATGNVDKFSWSNVAVSAISAGAGAGLGPVAEVSNPYLGAGIASARNNVMTQGASMVVGLQKSFDWRSVASSAISGTMGYGIGQGFDNIGIHAGSLDNNMIRGVAAGVASNGVRAAIYHQRQNVVATALDSFGSALGDAVVGSIQRADAAKNDDPLGDFIKQNEQKWSAVSPYPTEAELPPDVAARRRFLFSSTAGPGIPDVEITGVGWKGDFQLPDGTWVTKSTDPNETRRLVSGVPLDNEPPEVPGYELQSTKAYSWGKDAYYSARAAAEQIIDQAQAGAQATYSQWRDDAVASGSPAQYVGATFLELASDVGYDFARSGIGLYNLATSSQARSRAAQTVGYVATNPGVVVNAAVNGVRDFWNKPLNEQAQSVFKGGLSTLAGAGVAKMAAAVGGLPLTRTASAVDKYIDQLTVEGHGVQRHGANVSTQQLIDRAVEGLDPMTGTRIDGVHGGLHQYAQHATRMNSNEAYAFAEQYARGSQHFATETAASVTGRAQVKIPLRDVFGDDFRDHVSGITRYGPKATPAGYGSTAFSDDAYLVARYKQNVNGDWLFNTMFPEP